MYIKLSWRPEVDENWAIMVVQPATLTYPTMVFYFWLAPQFLFLEPSVCQKNTKNQYAVLPGMSVRVLVSHFSSVIGNFRSSGWLDLEWSTGISYQAQALANVLRYHTCRSSHPEDRKLPITELKWDTSTTIMAQFSSTSGLQDSLIYMCYTSKCLYMSLLYKYIQ
jgi:hypothetical protein